jgi:hypothetical protein
LGNLSRILRIKALFEQNLGIDTSTESIIAPLICDNVCSQFLPEHGEYDAKLKKWFCSYWMTEEEWMDIHHYSPTSKSDDEIQWD